MSNPTSYPVFEPDQVLTDTNLNALFAYLDQQEHLTRNKLIGIGIACGENTSWSGSTITITKGVGITSLGYLLLEDGDIYSHYRPYVLPDFPETIDPAVHAFYAAWQAQLLIPATQPKDVSDVALTANPSILKTHAVVLFLEPQLSDLKNCTTEDCNDKGKSVDITVRPLLVPKTTLQQSPNFGVQQQKFNFPQVHFQRWNVPGKNIQHPANVIEAFDAVLNAKLLRELDAALAFVYSLFGSMFKSEGDATQLTKVYAYLVALLKKVKAQNVLHYQYMYDYIDDLIKAYHDFRETVFDIVSQCCPDENLFPLHLMLGDADQDSSKSNTAYRNEFIYSPLFNQQKDRFATASLLYNRLVLLLQNFALPTDTSESTQVIRITPSYLGAGSLGRRCIPYYYNPVPLYASWDPAKTRQGNETLNYGYNAVNYSSDDAVLSPLLYDTEPNNFYRIEGHVGYPAMTALREIASQKLEYNLPIDVVALNLYPNSTIADSDKLTCYFSDLESAYNVLLSELCCKLHVPYCDAGKRPFNARIYNRVFTQYAVLNNDAVAQKERMTVENATATDATKMAAAAGNATTTDTTQTAQDADAEDAAFIRNQAYLQSYAASTQVPKITMVDSFVDKSRHVSPYKKGEYMQYFCNPEGNTTVAAYYMRWVLANPGKRWPKPQAVTGDMSTAAWNSLGYGHFLYLIDTVEELLSTLMPFDLSQVNYSRFKLLYDELMAEVDAYASFWDAYLFFKEQNADELTTIDLIGQSLQRWQIEDLVEKIASENGNLLMMCVDDRLQQLLFEYRKRVDYVLQQHIFGQYAKLKTGLEHKAGVTKGGTFVLLYYNKPDTHPDGDAVSAVPSQVNRADLAAVNITAAQQLKREAAVKAATAPQMKAATTPEMKAATTPEMKAATTPAAQMAATGTQRATTETATPAPAATITEKYTLNTTNKVSDADQIRQLMERNKDLIAVSDWQNVENILGRFATTPISPETLNIPQGVVFADLYIPYMCCSECAPTAFVFEQVPDDTPPPTIRIDGNSFCNNQEKHLPIGLTPETGGKVTGQGVFQDDGGNYYYNPLGLAAGTYVITYTVGNKVATTTITITAALDNDFTFVVKPLSTVPTAAPAGTTVSFTAVSQGGQPSWDFGDGNTSTDVNPDHTYAYTGQTTTYQVVHSIANGECNNDAVTKPVEVTLQNMMQLSIANNPLCTNGAPQALTYLPANGVMTCKEQPAAIVTSNGVFAFAPSVSGVGTFTVHYEINGQFKEISVQVQAAPSAEFTQVVTAYTANSVKVQFTSQSPDGTHTWTFDDGQSSGIANPLMEFSNLATGAPISSVKVTHNVSGALCGGGITKVVQIPSGPQRQDSSQTICYTTDAIVLEKSFDQFTLIDDGKQSIDGKSNMILNPKIQPGTQSSFTVVYQVTANGKTIEKHIAFTVYRLPETITVVFDPKKAVTFTVGGEHVSWRLYKENNPQSLMPLSDKTANPLVIVISAMPAGVDKAFNVEVDVTSGNCSTTLVKTINKDIYNKYIQGGGTVTI